MWIVSNLREGSLLPGDRLPSENALSEKLQVSTITIKRALDDLRRQGLIQRIQGRGSFVVGQTKITLDLERMFSLTTITQEHGMRPVRYTLEKSEMPAPPGAAKHLNLPAGERVAKLVRVRLMDKTPVAVDTSYLPARYFPDLLSVYNDRLSLYEVMRDRYKQEPVRARDILSPALINPYEFKALEIPVGTLGIMIERIGYGAEDIPLEFTKMVFRGDLCNFSIVFTKESYDRQPSTQ